MREDLYCSLSPFSEILHVQCAWQGPHNRTQLAGQLWPSDLRCVIVREVTHLRLWEAIPRLGPNQPMSAECVTHRAEAVGPPGPRADRRRLVQEAGPLLLAGEPLELRSERVVGRQEGLLAMQDRRVLAPGVVDALDLAGPQVELDAPQQGRVRVGLEVGVDEIGDLARVPVQLDQVGPLDLAEVGAGAALVDAEQRVERIEGGAMDVEGIRQELAHGRPSAGVVNGLGVADPEEPIVGLPAGIGVAAEERPDIPLETDREDGDRRTSPESPETGS